VERGINHALFFLLLFLHIGHIVELINAIANRIHLSGLLPVRVEIYILRHQFVIWERSHLCIYCFTRKYGWQFH